MQCRIIKVEHCGDCPYGPNRSASCGWVVPFQDGFPAECPLEDMNAIKYALKDWLNCADTPEEWMRCRDQAKRALEEDK